MGFVVSAVVLMIGMLALRFLIAFVAWLRSRRIERAAFRNAPAASSPSPVVRPALSVVQT